MVHTQNGGDVCFISLSHKLARHIRSHRQAKILSDTSRLAGAAVVGTLIHRFTGRAQPYHLLVAFIVTAGLLAWLFGSSRGRKLTGPWRSWLLVVALAGFLGLVTELMLRF
jgi:hypothetical protein